MAYLIDELARQEALREELLSEETIEWSGQPHQAGIFSRKDIALIPLSLLWNWLALSFEWSALANCQAHGVSAFTLFNVLFAVPFVLIGQYLLWGRFVFALSSKRQILYAVTNMRVLRISFSSRGRDVRAVLIRDIPKTYRYVGRNGIGTLVFGNQDFPLTFESFRDANSVYELIERLRKEAKEETKNPTSYASRGRAVLAANLGDEFARQEAVREELLSGETIEWTGQPDPAVIFSNGDAAMIVFSLMWNGFWFFWERAAILKYWEHTWPLYMVLFGVPFGLIGQYWLWGRYLYQSWWKKRTCYAVTNRRVLRIFFGLRAKKVHAVPILDIAAIQKRDWRNGVGTLILGEAEPALWFYDIHNAGRVYELLDRLRKEPDKQRG